MAHFRVRYIILPLLKAHFSLAIVVLLLSPTKIHRHESSVIPLNFSLSMNTVSVNGGHLFCRPPEARAMSVEQIKVLEALNLPNGTKVDAVLQKYGECRAKVIRLNESDDVCNCNPRIFFIILILMGVVATVTNLGNACFGPWKKNSSCAFYKFFDALSWVLIASCAIIFDYTNVETITLPNSKESVPYFQLVLLWCIACGLAFVYAIMAVLDGVIFLKFAGDKQKEESRKKLKDRRKALAKKVEPKRTVVIPKIAPLCRQSSEPMEKGIARLMMIRESVQPHYDVVTVTCRTWP